MRTKIMLFPSHVLSSFTSRVSLFTLPGKFLSVSPSLSIRFRNWSCYSANSRFRPSFSVSLGHQPLRRLSRTIAEFDRVIERGYRELDFENLPARAEAPLFKRSAFTTLNHYVLVNSRIQYLQDGPSLNYIFFFSRYVSAR